MNLIRYIAVLTLLIGGGAGAWAQDAAPPLKVRFLRVVKGKAPLPPMVHLAIEMNNPSVEPRWILVSLSRELRLPKDGKFSADPEGGLPFFVLEGKDETTGGRAPMVGFLGDPRFTAFYLPAGAKVIFEDFEFPSVEDLSEIDWLEAKAIRVDGKASLEKWLSAPLEIKGGTVLTKDAVWTDALRDDAGEPKRDVPRAKVSTVNAEVLRGGRLVLDGFETPARYFQPDPAKAQSLPSGWSLVAAFRPVRPLKVEHLAFAPDRSWLAASLQTYKVVGLELDRPKERLFPAGDRAMARFFAFSPEGNLLVKQATGPSDVDNQLDLADWTTGKVLDVLRFSSRVTLGNADHVPSPDGQSVAVLQRSGFNLWDFNKLESINRFVLPESVNGFTYKTGTFSPDGKRFAAGFKNPVAGGKALVWDVASGEVIAEFENKQDGISHLSFSGNGGLLAGTGHAASAVWVWSLDTKETHATLRDLPFASVHSVALSPDGTMLAVADEPLPGRDPTRGVVMFDVESQKKIAELPGLRQPITALTFSRDSRRLAAGDQLGAVRVWQRR
jgi:hypothetical protein